MNEKLSLQTLDKLYKNSPSIKIDDSDKIIIFSDLHMGDGNGIDDFRKNADIFKHILTEYYYPNDFKIVLNGDIEELYKFKYKDILNTWGDVYDIFSQFEKEGRLFKIVGNHDYEIYIEENDGHLFDLQESLILDYLGNKVFIYHGHQTANYIEQYNKMAMFFVRYIVTTLKIKNPTKPIGQYSKYRTEKIAYDFARSRKIISILGHTHRALFESMSKIDNIKMAIEDIINNYPRMNDNSQKKAEKQIKKFKKELENLYAKGRSLNLRNSLYNESLLVPCLFNSGSCISKNGLTGIEINEGMISLVYWFDINKSKKYTKKQYVKYKAVKTTQLTDSDYFKTILKEQSLEYIFTRIKLLA